jgi:hypothetical protein
VLAEVLLDRPARTGPEPDGVRLHGERIVGPWGPSTPSWESGPALEDVGAPATRVRPGSGGPVRVDVTPLFKRELPGWGIAIVGEARAGQGVSLVVSSPITTPLAGDRAPGRETPALSPRLELYVK